jgi:hypothetical protein
MSGLVFHISNTNKGSDFFRSTAKPELLCPRKFRVGSLLPGGRIDLKPVASGYINCGFALGYRSKKTKPRKVATEASSWWQEAGLF